MSQYHPRITLLLLCLIGLILNLTGCVSFSNRPNIHSTPLVIERTAVPDGVDELLWSKLLAAFEDALQSNGSNRQVSQPPTGAVNLITDAAYDPETGNLTWQYKNTGDYDRNGEVNLADITPIALYYGASEGDPDWGVTQVADGDGNLEVNLSDITPIAINYLSNIEGYLIEQSETGATDGTWVELTNVVLSDLLQGAIDPAQPLSYPLGIADKDVYSRVVPYSVGITGDPSNIVQCYVEPLTDYSISGICRTQEGAVLPWVLVSFGSEYTGVTGADGTFEITGIPDKKTGIVAPLLSGVSFDPPSKQLTVSGSDTTGLEFIASPVTTYGIYIDKDELAYLNANIWSSDYRPGLFVANGRVHEEAGFRYRGGTIRNMPKKSWKVELLSGNKFDDKEWGYKRGSMNLNSEYIDGSQMREMLSYSLIHEMGLVSPRARFARVYVNDEYYGLHTDVENPRKDWIQEFGYSGDGPLYQGMGSRMWAMPEVADYKNVFEKQMLEEDPYDDLALFIESLNAWEPAEVNAQFNSWIDVGQLAKYMVVNCLIQQADHIEANYFWYLDVTDSNKWLVVPWDHDRTWGKRYHAEMGLFSNDITFDERLEYGTLVTPWGNVVYDRYLSDPVFLGEYYAELQVALDTYFSEDLMIARIDEYEALVLDSVLADPLKWSSNEDWPTRVEDLRDYVRGRRQFIIDEMP